MALDQLTYREIHSPRLSFTDTLEVGKMQMGMLGTVYPLHDEPELYHAVRTTEHSRRNLNRAVGGELFWRRHQRFARPIGMIALEDDTPVAYLSVDDNASSREEGIVGLTNQLGKLWWPSEKAITHRYARIGGMFLSLAYYDQVEKKPDALNPIDVMFTLLAQKRDPHQPVSAYTGQEETVTNYMLSGMGLRVVEDEEQTRIKPFGPHGSAVWLDRWRGESVEAVVDTIRQKDGAVRAIDAARHHLGLTSLRNIRLL